MTADLMLNKQILLNRSNLYRKGGGLHAVLNKNFNKEITLSIVGRTN